MRFVCLWCCFPPEIVVQKNNFFSLVLLSALIHKRTRNKLIRTIKYKIDSSSKMQFTFFILKTFKNLLPSKLKTIDFVENLEMTQVYGDAGGGGGGLLLCIIMTQCIRKLICYSLLKSDNQIIPVMLTFRPVQSFEKYCNNTIPALQQIVRQQEVKPFVSHFNFKNVR